MNNSNALGRISDAIQQFILAVIVSIFLLVCLLATFFFAGVLYITPQADLPRNNDGIFLINSDNYNQWHTYSRLFHSSSQKAVFDGDYVLRAVSAVEHTCDKIKNCENYESKFYKAGAERDVWLIKKSDDQKFTDYVTLLNNSVKEHNNKIESFSTKLDYEKPDFPDIFAINIDYKEAGHDASSQTRLHNQKVKRAKTQCLNNGIGCEVRPYAGFSYFGFPNLNVEVN